MTDELQSSSGAALATECGHVVELRRYTLHPGARERLIALFDREFVETQEAVGMRVVGQFRDLDAPDAFVWLRGFPDMARRAAALAAFYGGPVWAAHRDAANATMIAFDDVRLLKPRAGRLALADRQPPGTEGAAPGLVAVTVFPLRPGAVEAFPAFFDAEVAPAMTAAGGPVAAAFTTETSPNTFPALPVRTDAAVLVAVARFPDAAAHAAFAGRLSASPAFATAMEEAERRLLAGPYETLRLSPTARSRLR